MTNIAMNPRTFKASSGLSRLRALRMGGSDCLYSEIGGDACGFLHSHSFSLPLIIVNILVHETNKKRYYWIETWIGKQ